MITKDKFIEKYSHLFQDNIPSLECGDGWLILLDRLCGLINNNLNNVVKYNDHWLENKVVDIFKYEENKVLVHEFKITQIKEKFGGLRFYTVGGNEQINGWIRFAELISYDTCEECGTNQNIGVTSGWFKTMCRHCAIDKNKGDVWMSKEDRAKIMEKNLKKLNNKK